MSKKCPNYDENIEYLEVSKQIDIESMKLMTPENIYEAVGVG